MLVYQSKCAYIHRMLQNVTNMLCYMVGLVFLKSAFSWRIFKVPLNRLKWQRLFLIKKTLQNAQLTNEPSEMKKLYDDQRLVVLGLWFESITGRLSSFEAEDFQDLCLALDPMLQVAMEVGLEPINTKHVSKVDWF